MNDIVEINSFKNPLGNRFKALAFSYLASFAIGLFVATVYIFAYSVQYYGPEKLVWGVGQALMPESEVKQELAKLQSDLQVANSKLANITKAISNARKLSAGGFSNISDARARLANPSSAPQLDNTTREKSDRRKVMKVPAQGGAEDGPDSMLESLLIRLRNISSKPSQFESNNYLSILQSTPIGVPVSGELTSDFGLRTSPFSGFRQNHRGIDVAMNRGAELFATADGVVEVAGWGGAYGNQIIIDHGIGSDGDRFETLYAHLSRIYVKPGSQVKRGERIGQVGTTGHSTGPHVHYEVRKNGIPINPEPFVELAGLLD
jgi:murein DD-endopeptidase MepM/ murein hydrolase activator NlpD